MTTIGILSDTHLGDCPQSFQTAAAAAFGGCDAIIHAGDLTDLSVLQAFGNKKVYGVHGNMCTREARQALPSHRTIEIDGHTIGICHGAGPRHNIEERMLDLFPDVDCIVYGHTHIQACHRIAGILLINPGSFQATGPYGAPAGYGKLFITPDTIHGSLHHYQPSL